ncbi:hypothetical protein ACJX0J_006247, partial [Zea mays]
IDKLATRLNLFFGSRCIVLLEPLIDVESHKEQMIVPRKTIKDCCICIYFQDFAEQNETKGSSGIVHYIPVLGHICYLFEFCCYLHITIQIIGDININICISGGSFDFGNRASKDDLYILGHITLHIAFKHILFMWIFTNKAYMIDLWEPIAALVYNMWSNFFLILTLLSLTIFSHITQQQKMWDILYLATECLAGSKTAFMRDWMDNLFEITLTSKVYMNMYKIVESHKHLVT